MLCASASRQENPVTAPVNPTESYPSKATETLSSPDPESQQDQVSGWLLCVTNQWFWVTYAFDFFSLELESKKVCPLSFIHCPCFSYITVLNIIVHLAPFYTKIRNLFASFSPPTKRRWDGEAQADFKRVQLIKNRTDTNMHKHTHTHCPQSQQTVYEWSSNRQVVIRHNTGTTSATLLCCSLLLCVQSFHVSANLWVCVCVCVSMFASHSYTYIAGGSDVLTGPSMNLKRQPKEPQLRDAWIKLLEKEAILRKYRKQHRDI